MGWLDYINSGEKTDTLNWGIDTIGRSLNNDNRLSLNEWDSLLQSDPAKAKAFGGREGVGTDYAFNLALQKSRESHGRDFIDPYPQSTPFSEQEFSPGYFLPNATTDPATDNNGGIFDLPTLTKDVYPKSSSGIDFESGFGPTIQPAIESSIENLPGLASQFGSTLQDQYSNLMRRSLGPEAFQGTLNQLANRGMLNSSVAGNALSDTSRNIMTSVGDRAYESQLQGLQQQMQLPGLLGQLAQLLQKSESTNPIAPYDIASRFY